MSANIYDDLKNLKKAEIVEFYAKQYNVSGNIVETMYNFLTNCKQDDLKRLRKGTYKFKYRIKRNNYDNGQTLEGNILVNSNIEEIKNE